METPINENMKFQIRQLPMKRIMVEDYKSDKDFYLRKYQLIAHNGKHGLGVTFEFQLPVNTPQDFVDKEYAKIFEQAKDKLRIGMRTMGAKHE